MRLDADDIQAIASRVVELMREDRDQPREVMEAHNPLTAAQVADRLGVSVDCVYRHQDELGARRLGTGPRARLRFPAEAVERYGESSQEETKRVAHLPRRRSAQRSTDSVPLLPIGRKRAA